MSGHSKWSNIKHRKAHKDSKREKIFTKITKELSSAIKIGGKDINYNFKLRSLMNKALSNNMKKKTLNNILDFNINQKNYKLTENITYEAYGPGNIAIIIECITNNRNRTVSLIRYALNKFGGNLTTHGSVKYLFKKCGFIYFKGVLYKNNIINTISSIIGNDFIIYENNDIEIYINKIVLDDIKNKLILNNIIPNHYGFKFVPFNYIKVNQDNKNKLLNLINTLKNYNDIKNIYHNGEIFLK